MCLVYTVRQYLYLATTCPSHALSSLSHGSCQCNHASVIAAHTYLALPYTY